jgi:hypothetical protein
MKASIMTRSRLVIVLLCLLLISSLPGQNQKKNSMLPKNNQEPYEFELHTESSRDHDEIIRIAGDIKTLNVKVDNETNQIDFMTKMLELIVAILLAIVGGAFFVWKELIRVQERLRYLYRELGESANGDASH